MDLIVSVDRSRVKDGKLDEVRASFLRLVSFVEAHEPRPLAYGVHIHPQGRDVTVVQIHPDSASMETHLDVASTEFARFRDLLEIVSIDLYGRPSEALLARMQAKAKLLGHATVLVHPPVAGFARVGTPAPFVEEPGGAHAGPAGRPQGPRGS